MTLVSIALALLLAGCATTLPEFRQQAPVQSGAVIGEYLPLATCTRLGLEDDEVLAGIGTTFRLADDAPGRWASVLGRMLKVDGLYAPIPSPVVEVVFRQEAAQQVRVAVRAEPVGWPERAAWLPAHSAAQIVRRAEAVIARCAGAPVALQSGS
ncbi:MAG: hypothetical protein ACREKJ_01225 [Candidatus Rokuibacteriota bacterium]